MINTIFYFVDEAATYQTQLLNNEVSSRTIAFCADDRTIRKNGLIYGSGVINSYDLPAATTTNRGGITVGDFLKITTGTDDKLLVDLNRLLKEIKTAWGLNENDTVDLSQYVKFSDRASKNSFGVVKLGDNIEIDQNGAIYANIPQSSGNYTLQHATSDNLGGIKLYRSSDNGIVSTTTNDPKYAVELDENDKAFVRIKAISSSQVETEVPSKSICFTRTNYDISGDRPTGGTWQSQIPTSAVQGSSDGWSDGIPDGEAMIWATSAEFVKRIAANGTVTYDPVIWKLPSKMSDNDTFDVEFAYEQANNAMPPLPDTNNRHKDLQPYGYVGLIWFDPDKDRVTSSNGDLRDFSNMVWRAERHKQNGEWGEWVIVRIKGEKGDSGDIESVEAQNLITTIVEEHITTLTETIELLVLDFDDLQLELNTWSELDINDAITSLLNSYNTTQWNTIFHKHGWDEAAKTWLSSIGLVTVSDQADLNGYYPVVLNTSSITQSLTAIEAEVAQISALFGENGELHDISSLSSQVTQAINASEAATLAVSLMQSSYSAWNTDKPNVVSAISGITNTVTVMNDGKMEALSRMQAAVISDAAYSASQFQAFADDSSTSAVMASNYGIYNTNQNGFIYLVDGSSNPIYDKDEEGRAIPYTSLRREYAHTDLYGNTEWNTNPSNADTMTWEKLVPIKKGSSPTIYVQYNDLTGKWYELNNDLVTSTEVDPLLIDWVTETVTMYDPNDPNTPLKRSRLVKLFFYTKNNLPNNANYDGSNTSVKESSLSIDYDADGNYQWVTSSVDSNYKVIKTTTGKLDLDTYAYHRTRLYTAQNIAGIVTQADVDNAITTAFAATGNQSLISGLILEVNGIRDNLATTGLYATEYATYGDSHSVLYYDADYVETRTTTSTNAHENSNWEWALQRDYYYTDNTKTYITTTVGDLSLKVSGADQAFKDMVFNSQHVSHNDAVAALVGKVVASANFTAMVENGISTAGINADNIVINSSHMLDLNATDYVTFGATPLITALNSQLNVKLVTATKSVNNVNHTISIDPEDGIQQSVGGTVKNQINQDGSGSLASGNLSWTSDGSTTIRGTFTTGDSEDEFCWKMHASNTYSELELSKHDSQLQLDIVLTELSGSSVGGFLRLNSQNDGNGAHYFHNQESKGIWFGKENSNGVTVGHMFSLDLSQSGDAANTLVLGEHGTYNNSTSNYDVNKYQCQLATSDSSASIAVISPSTDATRKQITLSVNDTNPTLNILKGNSSYTLSDTGAVSASDMRLKDVIADKVLTAEQIAMAPIFTYTPKNNSSSDPIVGTSAQYWNDIMPEVVKEINNYLSLDYTKVATASVINLAKEVVTLKSEKAALTERIEALEARLQLIENKLNS